RLFIAAKGHVILASQVEKATQIVQHLNLKSRSLSFTRQLQRGLIVCFAVPKRTPLNVSDSLLNLCTRFGASVADGAVNVGSFLCGFCRYLIVTLTQLNVAEHAEHVPELWGWRAWTQSS